jgi:hypothetical protein
MSFYRDLVKIEAGLIQKGWTVNIPISAATMKHTNDFDVSHFKNVHSDTEKGIFIRNNFQKIAESDAILVINNEKNGIAGYIGTNVLMEIAIAHYTGKKIFLWNPISDTASYREELLSFGCITVHQSLDLIQV